MATKGVLLCAWSRACYGYAAFNFAASIKHLSPDVHITLMADGGAMRDFQDAHKRVFDSIIPITEPVTDPGLFKAGIYDKLPYDFTLYMDVDALAINPISTLLDKLISEYEADKDGKFYRIHVHDWYDSTSPEDMPMMYWAKKSVIWNKYGFDSTHKLPGTQSSIQFIAKCDKAEKFYDNFYRTMADDPIPLYELKHMWGGTQPDELYLNIQIARDRLTPDINSAMWFCDNSSKMVYQLQQEGYTFLSYFGVRERVKAIFQTYYNREPVRFLRAMGFGNHNWKFNSVFDNKHAANKVKPITRMASGYNNVVALKQAGQEIFKPTTHKKTYLFTTYYGAKSGLRQQELLTCLKNNIANPYIDKVFVLSECEIEHDDPKLTVIPFHRATFREVVDFANSQDGDINILCNTDIFCDETIGMTSDLNLNNKVLCLCRHDILPRGQTRFIEAEYSQDTWIWQGKLNFQGGDYKFGILGCDNVFAYQVNQSGYAVHNPSRHIKTMHLHLVGERNYSEATRLPRPYLHVPVSTLDGLKEKRLLIIQPGKVGDIIRCLPIAAHYAKDYTVHWQAPKEYDAMFSQVDYCKRVDAPLGNYDKVIDLSFGLNQTSELHKQWLKQRSNGLDSFVSLKYEIASIEKSECFNLKYTRNEAKENLLFDELGLNENIPYALIHTSSDYGTAITVEDSGIKTVHFKPVSGYTIFDWKKVIEKASEIHAIDSSLVNFADVCDTKAVLFYYITDKVPMQADRTLLQKDWETINTLEYANS